MTKNEAWQWTAYKRACRGCDFAAGRDTITPLNRATDSRTFAAWGHSWFDTQFNDFAACADWGGQYGGGEIYAHD